MPSLLNSDDTQRVSLTLQGVTPCRFACEPKYTEGAESCTFVGIKGLVEESSAASEGPCTLVPRSADTGSSQNDEPTCPANLSDFPEDDQHQQWKVSLLVSDMSKRLQVVFSIVVIFHCIAGSLGFSSYITGSTQGVEGSSAAMGTTNRICEGPSQVAWPPWWQNDRSGTPSPVVHS